jgi:hypothetical protein
MSTLIHSLDRILTWLTHHHPNLGTSFLPGLSRAELEAYLETLPFQVSQEVYDLYQWRGGTVGEQGLFVYHWFHTLSEIEEVEDILNDPEWINLREEQGQPLYLFPLFGFDGEYLLVPGIQEPLQATPVYQMNCEDSSLRIGFDSLTQMMGALAECYEQGLYQSMLGSYLTMTDPEKFGAIRRQYNPKSVLSLYPEGW